MANEGKFLQYVTGYIDTSTGKAELNKGTNGAALVTSVDPANLPHVRYRSGITATIATGTKTVTFTQLENVRKVRFYFSNPVLFRVVFDAVDDADAQAKLATAADSATTDVQYHLVDGATNAQTAALTLGNLTGWSEWYEFSQYPDDLSLSRIDMVADSDAGPHTVYVEGV